MQLVIRDHNGRAAVAVDAGAFHAVGVEQADLIVNAGALAELEEFTGNVPQDMSVAAVGEELDFILLGQRQEVVGYGLEFLMDQFLFGGKALEGEGFDFDMGFFVFHLPEMPADQRQQHQERGKDQQEIFDGLEAGDRRSTTHALCCGCHGVVSVMKWTVCMAYIF